MENARKSNWEEESRYEANWNTWA